MKPTRWFALALALAACESSPSSKDVASRTADDVFAELAEAGLAVEGKAALDGAALGGGTCARASVGGVEVTACRHADDAAATAAKPQGLAAVGDATGAALAKGPVVLVVADRAAKDPSGRTIDRITRAFLRRPAPSPKATDTAAAKPAQ